jgi:uncharacterized phiE125 gp8 family phage protein
VRSTFPYLVSRYTSEPVTLDEAREWLRLDIAGYEAEDSTIAQLVESAIDYVEKECNISLGVSEYEWYTECLPCVINDAAYVKSIVSIEEETETGYTAINESNYSLIQTGERSTRIKWKSDFSSSADSYKIRFTAGFNEGEIPQRLLIAVRILISKWYDNRNDSVEEKKTAVDRILSAFRIPYAG